MFEEIKTLEQKDVSGEELLHMVKYKSNLLEYSDLHKYTNIEEVLGYYGCCIILYQTESEYEGHWTCIFKSNKNQRHLLFFDSYGLGIDTELKYSEFNKSLHKGRIVSHLRQLISNSNYSVTSNHFKLQQNRSDIATCGRYVATRINNRDMSNRQYVNFIRALTKDLSKPPYKIDDPDYNTTLLSLTYF